MRLLLAAATALVLIPSAASAADWFRILEGPGATWYLDADSIQRNGDWTRYEQFAVYDEVSRGGIKTVSAIMEIDCGRRKYRLARFTSFRADGVQVDALDDPENGAEHDNTPGSAIDVAMKFVCDNDRSAERVADPRAPTP